MVPRRLQAIRDSDTVAGYLKADRKKRADDLAQYLENEHLIHRKCLHINYSYQAFREDEMLGGSGSSLL